MDVSASMLLSAKVAAVAVADSMSPTESAESDGAEIKPFYRSSENGQLIGLGDAHWLKYGAHVSLGDWNGFNFLRLRSKYKTSRAALAILVPPVAVEMASAADKTECQRRSSRYWLPQFCSGLSVRATSCVRSLQSGANSARQPHSSSFSCVVPSNPSCG